MKETILSKENILEIGTPFDDLDFSDDDQPRIVFHDGDGNERLFTGLVYDVSPNNGLINSYMFVKDGLKDGQYVEFYPNGQLKSVTRMKEGVSWGERYEFYDTENIQKVTSIIAGFTMTFTKYDHQGNIIEEKTEPSDFDKRMALKFGGQAWGNEAKGDKKGLWTRLKNIFGKSGGVS